MSADELDRLERERREADARYNDALTTLDRAIVSMDGRDPSRDDAARIGSALLTFLQQITAFVESKDRQLAADTKARGETLAALKAARVPARGIDANDSMVAAARERGLDAARADARAYLDALPEASLGGIVATQVVEHLEPAYLMRLLDGAAR